MTGDRTAATVAPETSDALTAFTFALRPEQSVAINLIEWAGPDGYYLCTPQRELAGRGCIRHVAIPGGLARLGFLSRTRSDPIDVLSSIETFGAMSPGTGAIVIGSLPFDPHADAQMHVPEIVIGRSRTTDDSIAWVTVIQSSDLPAPANSDEAMARSAVDQCRNIPRRSGHATPGTNPDAFILRPSPSHLEWTTRVSEAINAIHDGEIEKVVLAREVVVETNQPIVIPNILDRLSVLYPSCTIFHVDGFVGASPELLLRRIGRTVSSFPLAGTIPHSGDPATDQCAQSALLASIKERHEHHVTADAVAQCLGSLCEELDVPESPSIVSLRNVSHLGTDIRGMLRSDTVAPSALELVARLHPTPAVSGTPTHAAMSWISKLETFDRDCYAGPVGWMDARGDGEFFVGIRAAFISGHRARLLAGAGIVADSDPHKELLETQLKFQALLAALVRP